MARKSAKKSSKNTASRKRLAGKRPDPAPVAEAAPAAKEAPRFSAEGVLLNPEACHVGADGVVTAK